MSLSFASFLPPSLRYGATGWSEDAKNLLRKKKNERGRHDTRQVFLKWMEKTCYGQKKLGSLCGASH
jgi:hypothetical protein